MQPPLTKRRSLSSDHKGSTDAASLECASISASERGLWAEDQALCVFLKQGYSLRGRRQKIAGIEIDLILWRQGWLLLEVKALSHEDRMPNRVSQSQLRRLGLALEIFRQRVEEPVVMGAVYVQSASLRFLRLEDHGG